MNEQDKVTTIRTAKVNALIRAAETASARLWQSESDKDREAGDDLDAALAALRDR
jgi:hypothetical protein